MNSEQGEVLIKKTGGEEQPKTFTFDLVYDKEYDLLSVHFW